MKNLKMLISALAVSTLMFLTGCNEQPVSSGEPTEVQTTKSTTHEVQDQIDRGLFKTQIRLKPFRSYTFSYENSGLVSFNSIDAERIYTPVDDANWNQCKDLKITTSQVSKIILTCKSGKFNVKDLTVENTGSSIIDVNVVLTGQRPKDVIPVQE